MSYLRKELVFLILQFFGDEGYKEAAHMLERESGFYFDMNYFEDMVLSGKWDEAERYLSGFTNVDDNKYSTKIYFELRKQHFLEALDNNCRAKALDILMKDLKVFAKGNEELFKEMTKLLAFDNIREHESLSMYGDTMSARKNRMQQIKEIIEANPLFRGKLKVPGIKSQRLRGLINQSLNWQHMHCEYPNPNPAIQTLFIDHVCEPQDSFSLSQPTEINSQPLQATSYPFPTSYAESSPSTLTQSTLCSGALPLNAAKNPAIDYSDDLSKQIPFGTSDEASSTVTDPGQGHISELAIPNDFPNTVALTLNEALSPTSMDFHPVWQTFLLVGTCVGDIGVWDVSSGEKLLSRNFGVWDLEPCSMALKEALVKGSNVSVNRVIWGPDGCSFGVAYSKHIVQLYTYCGGSNIHQQLEIDAHLGSVNDIAFSSPHGQLFVITCGDDKTVKVWDVVSGNRWFTFEGHEAPVYSVCPHAIKNVHFIFSTTVDGKIKAWLYDNLGARVDFDAPGLGCTKMAYSADDQRLFSCGTNKGGQSFLVEWNDHEGTLKRIYQGLGKNPLSVVQFDTTKNQFLAAGDDHMVKFWDMDNTELLTTIDANGGLPANPHICFNKEGTLLAVFANENRIKILATDCGLRLLQKSENDSTDASGVEFETSRKNGDPRYVEEVQSKITGEASNREKAPALLVINRPSQCHSLKLSAHVKRKKISRLIYTNAGDGILALASDAIHLLWKWPQDDLNSSGKATTKVHPPLWQPRNGLQVMSNDLTSINPEEAVPCFALSNNDSYLMSASGGMISLFNMITFKTMMKVMPPPPAATSLAFHPQDNNIVAIGMDNSTIVIYNVHSNKVTNKLEGHTKEVTGLAFSNTLNVLVSSGADAQIFVWNADGWEKQRGKLLQIPDGQKWRALSDTHIQFHQDQLHFLAIHKTHLAVYEAKELGCVKQWFAGSSTPISHATFSCDSQIVYASFINGSIGIFDASVLELRCQINPSAYIPADISCSQTVYPVVIAAHPQNSTQFAVGLSNGEVYVLEPLEPDAGKCGVLPLDDTKLKSSEPMKYEGILRLEKCLWWNC